MAWHRRLLNLFRSERLSKDIERELSFHVAERADELMAAGLSEREARREAMRRFGNVGLKHEDTRAADLFTWLETIVADLRYAMRALLASPGFALVAVLSLGLGIGANTAIYSLIDALLLKTLPVRDPQELLQVNFGGEKGDVFTNPLWEQVRDRQDVFASAFAYNDNTFNLAERGEKRFVNGSFVSGDYFATLGVRPAVGRLLVRSDDVRGCSGAAVIGDELWRTEYGASQEVTSRSISLNGHTMPIVGVAEASFFGMDVGSSAQVFVPLCAEAVMNGEDSMLDRRSTWFLRVMGRPLPGITPEIVVARLQSLAPAVYDATVPEHWTAQRQQEYRTRKLGAIPAPRGTSWLRGQYTTALFALMGIVAVVLLIACANVANLLLARATVREREVAIRLAIGAGRRRLVRQLLTESLLLSLFGAAAGILFARWGSSLLVRLLSTQESTVWLDLSISMRVLGFTIGVAIVTGVFFGLAPAWRSARVHPQIAMKANSRGMIEGHSRFSVGKALVIAQIALSLVLVATAGLLLGTFRTLSTVRPGFSAEGVMIASVDLNNIALAQAARRGAYRALLERVRSIPGVASASVAAITPLSGSSWNDQIVADGFTPASEEDALSWMNEVSDGYFASLGSRFIAGRDFGAQEQPGTPPVAVINETFARKYFGEQDPLGREFGLGVPESRDAKRVTVIGVVEDAKYGSLRDDAQAIAYLSLDQSESPPLYLSFLVRSPMPAGTVSAAIQNVALEMHPQAGLTFVTLERQVADSLTRERLLATLSGFFGALALLLSMIGLYGVMSYNVARRRNEIGIRMALGAARRRVLGGVLGEIGWMVLAGVAAGAVAAYSGLQLISSFLYGVAATDITTLAAAAGTLAVVAGCAGALPAWRAARLDPMAALRED
jgi:putative ABC transport system permease protein